MSLDRIYIVLSDPRERDKPILKVTYSRKKALEACRRYLINQNSGKDRYWKSIKKAKTVADEMSLFAFYDKYACALLTYPMLFMKMVG